MKSVGIMLTTRHRTSGQLLPLSPEGRLPTTPPLLPMIGSIVPCLLTRKDAVHRDSRQTLPCTLRRWEGHPSFSGFLCSGFTCIRVRVAKQRGPSCSRQVVDGFLSCFYALQGSRAVGTTAAATCATVPLPLLVYPLPPPGCLGSTG